MLFTVRLVLVASGQGNKNPIFLEKRGSALGIYNLEKL